MWRAVASGATGGVTTVVGVAFSQCWTVTFALYICIRGYTLHHLVNHFWFLTL
jgi:hypothetical protein